jgi:hypothetical protein
LARLKPELAIAQAEKSPPKSIIPVLELYQFFFFANFFLLELASDTELSAKTDVAIRRNGRLVLHWISDNWILQSSSPSALRQSLAFGRETFLTMTWYPWALTTTTERKDTHELRSQTVFQQWPILLEDVVKGKAIERKEFSRLMGVDYNDKNRTDISKERW